MGQVTVFVMDILLSAYVEVGNIQATTNFLKSDTENWLISQILTITLDC